MPLSLPSIAKAILIKLRAAHVGREFAIKRHDLLAELRQIEPLLTDRQMRRAIEFYAPWVCACRDGYFLAQTNDEKKAAIAYQLKKLIGQRRRVDAIARAYPELETFIQLELGL